MIHGILLQRWPGVMVSDLEHVKIWRLEEGPGPVRATDLMESVA